MKDKSRNPRPSATHNSCMDETEIDGFGIGMGSGSGKPPVDVFLLSLPGTHGPRVGDVHDMFRQWIQSVGCQVHDILDPEMVRFEFCFVFENNEIYRKITYGISRLS